MYSKCIGVTNLLQHEIMTPESPLHQYIMNNILKDHGRFNVSYSDMPEERKEHFVKLFADWGYCLNHTSHITSPYIEIDCPKQCSIYGESDECWYTNTLNIRLNQKV